MYFYAQLNEKAIVTAVFELASEIADEKPFEGDKIPIADVLNKEIIVHSYRISQSKKKEGTQYITLQIEIEGQRRVIFTGSEVIFDLSKKYADKMPFSTVIKKINKFYTFT